MKKLLLVCVLALYPSLALAQLPVATVNDTFSLDVFLDDITKPSFKLQIQLDSSTGTWADIASLPAPTVLPDTSAGYTTYTFPISKTTVGNHTVYFRTCAVTSGTTPTCSAAASLAFTFSDVTVPGLTPTRPPVNLRIKPKAGGGLNLQ